MSIKKYKSDLKELAESIKILVTERRREINRSVSNEILVTYWGIGKLII